MKILLLGDFDTQDIVPAPIKVGKELFNAYIKKGFNVAYLPYFQDGKIYSRFQKLFGFKRIAEKVYRTGIFPLINFVIKFRPRIIHIITPALYYIVLFPLKIFFRFKTIVTLHAINRYVLKHLSDIKGYPRLRFLLIEYLTLKFCDRVFVYSQRDKRYICRYYNIPRKKVDVICNGMNNLDIVKSDYSVHSNLKVAFIGDVNRKEKDFKLLFDALLHLNLPVELSLYCFEYQSDTGKFISDNIKLKIFQPLREADLRNELIKNDLIIQPSLLDSFPLSLLEAMNSGMLFIISDRIGFAELIQSEFEELIFPRRSEEMLIARINYILGLSAEQKQNLSERIRNYSLSFSWEKISEEYITKYKDVLIS